MADFWNRYGIKNTEDEEKDRDKNNLSFWARYGQQAEETPAQTTVNEPEPDSFLGKLAQRGVTIELPEPEKKTEETKSTGTFLLSGSQQAKSAATNLFTERLGQTAGAERAKQEKAAAQKEEKRRNETVRNQEWLDSLRSAEDIQKDLDAVKEQQSTLDKKAFKDNALGLWYDLVGQTEKKVQANEETRAAREGLSERQKALEDELAERKWADYERLRDKEDFEKNSQYKNTANGTETKLNPLGGYDSVAFDDPLYEYVNGNEEAGKVLAMEKEENARQNGILGFLVPEDTYNYEQVSEMTDDERAMYNYIHATEGSQAAYEYLDYLRSDLYARQMENEKKEAKAYAREHPVLSTIGTIGLSPLRGAAFLGQTAQYLTEGSVDENAPYNRVAALPAQERETVTKMIENRWGKAGSFAYQTGVSMAEFMLNSAITGGKFSDKFGRALSLAIMGTGAAPEATIEAKERGLNDTQAYAIGAVAGAAEIVTELVSIEALFSNPWKKTGLAKWLQKALYIGQNVAAEGSEEAASDVINWMADVLMNYDKSEWRQSMKAYEDEGMDENEAFVAALKDKGMSILMSAAGGAASGGLMASSAVTLDTIFSASQRNQDRSQVIEAARSAAQAAQKVNAPVSPVAAAQTQGTPGGAITLPTAADEMGAADASRGASEIRMGAEPAPGLKTADEVELENKVAKAKNITEATGIKYGADKADIRAAEKYSRMTGMDVEFYSEGSKNGTAQNGYYDPSTNKIYYNVNAKEKFRFTFGHEFTHGLEGTRAYNALSDLVKTRIDEAGEDLDMMRAQIQDRYDRAGIKLTAEQVDQEIVADWIGNNLSDERTIREICRENASVGKQIRDALDSFITRAADMQGIVTKYEEEKYKNVVKAYDRYLRRNQAIEERNQAQPITNTQQEGTESVEAYLERMSGLYEAGEITEEQYQDAQAIAAEMESTGRGFESSTVERDTGPEGKIPSLLRNVRDRAAGRQYSISRDEDGTPFVKVDDTRIDTSDKNKLYSILKDIVKSKDFRNMVANGQNFGITNNQGVREWIRGKKSMELFRTDPQAYDDKQQSFQNANELLQASRDYINEETQDKKNVYSSMARGKINFKVGENGYEADIIVGIRHDQSAELYNVVGVTPKKITESSSAGASANNAALGSQENSVNDILSQPAEEVKGIYEKTEGNAEPAAVSPDGEVLTEELPGGTMVKYSLSSWNETDKDAVMKNLVKAGYSWSDAQSYIDNVNSIAAIIAGDTERLDYNAADNQVFMKPNAEYVITLDASTLCAKRLTYQGTFNKIQHALGNQVLMPEDLIDLANMMAKDGYQTPCGICYVESRRRHLGKFADQWLADYKGAYKPNLDEVTTTDGLERLRHEHPDTYEDFVKAMNKKGTMNPKVVQLRTDYRGDINRLTKGQIAKIKRIGGVRVQSFSDFETPHLIDMMQAVLDMSAKELPAQAYTKVPNFAWVFGDTGIKINLSLIGGIDENGNLTFSNTEGINFDEAMKLRERYSENVGTILVGMNDAHILKAMADPRIDYIIPFHKSGWSAEELEKMVTLRGFEDYTDQQNEKLIVGKKANGGYETKSVVEGEGNLYPEDYWDYNVSGRENAERYLALCAEKSRLPKFSKFLVDNGDGTFSLQPDGSTDGYWKTLIDYRMYDNEGNGVPQRAVRPDFNMEEAERVLAEYQGGANELPSASDEFIEKYVDHYNAVHGGEERRYSVSDDDYMRAVEDGDMETAQRMVDEAAREAGYNIKVYHGTANAGRFNIFDPKKLNNTKISSHIGQGFYFTNSKSGAQEYMREHDIYGNSKKGKNPYLFEGYIKLQNPIEVETNSHNLTYDAIRNIISDGDKQWFFNNGIPHELQNKEINGIKRTKAEISELTKDEKIDLYARYLLRYGDMNALSSMVDAYSYGNQDLLLEAMKKHTGKDGIHWQMREGLDQFVVFDSSQFKESAPVEYDDNGNVIPLSERFNTEEQDIRYSVSDDDYMRAVENGDTETQEKMVEEAARAAGYNSPKLYHGTQNYGFTEFDLDMMDDSQSIFLTDNKYVAESYSGTLLTGTPGGPGGRMVNGVLPDAAYSMPLDDAVKMYNELHEHDRPVKVLDRNGLTNLIDKELAKIHKSGETARKLLEKDSLLNQWVEHGLFSEEELVQARPLLEAIERFADAETADELETAYDEYSNVLGDADLMNNRAVRTIQMMTDAFENLANSPRFAARFQRLNDRFDKFIWNGNLDVMPESELRDELNSDLNPHEEDLFRRYEDANHRHGNYAVYARYNNPLRLNTGEGTWDDITFLPDELKQIRRRMKAIEKANHGVTLNNEEWERLDREFWDRADELYDEFGINVNGGNNTRSIADYAKSIGYDAVILEDVYDIGENAYDEYASDVYILFDPNNIKSADPVTYDENGDVIPLSERFNTGEQDIRYSIVDDPETLDFLENQDTVKVYRAMQMIDGELYPPMAAKVEGKFVEPTRIGEWYQADERPDLVKNGKFVLNKGNGSTVPAAYNPYFHSSASPLNDQFSSAYKRPNLVVVEGEIPSSELTSGYRAEGAKNAVGETSWHAGPVASKLKGEKARRVYLSRWFKVDRVMTDAEVADIVADTLQGENVTVPSNVVTPSLLEELRDRGVPISDVRYSVSDEERYNRTALLTEETVDRYLRDYAAKGSPNYAQAYITRMDPEKYLDLTTSRLGRMRISDETGPMDEGNLVDATRRQPIQLRIEDGEVVGHEGRHRAMAMARKGIRSIPVLVFDSSNKYSKTDMPEMEVSGQDFGNGNRSYTRTTLTDLIPLSYANRDRIINEYGQQSAMEQIGERYGRKTMRLSVSDNEPMTLNNLTQKAQSYALRAENTLATAVAQALGVETNRTRDAYKTFRAEIVRPVIEAMLRGEDVYADQFLADAGLSLTEAAAVRSDVEEALKRARGEIGRVRRSVNERAAEQEARERRNAEIDAQIPDDAEGRIKMANAFKDAKKRWTNAKARTLMTDEDIETAHLLALGQISEEEAYARSPYGYQDVIGMAEAERDYIRTQAPWERYTKRLAERRYEMADRDLENADRAKDKASGFQYARETPERNFRDVFGSDAGRLIDDYIRPIHKSEAISTRFKNDYIKRVKDLGLSQKVAHGNQNSEATAVQFLGEAEDNVRYLEAMRRPDAVRDGQTLDEWRSAIEQFKAANPNLNYTKINEAISEFGKIYGELIDQMNTVLVDNGYMPVNIRRGYFPHFNGGSDGILSTFAHLLGINIESNALPTAINGLTSGFKPGKAWFGHAQERTGFRTDYDAIQGFDGYIGGVSDVIHQTGNIRNLRALSTRIRWMMGDEQIRNRINEIEANDTLPENEKQALIQNLKESGKYNLSRFVAWLDEYTNLLANKKSKYDRGVEDLMGRRFYTWMKNIEGRVAANMISGNLGSALTNFIPLNQAGAMLGDYSMLRGAFDTMTGRARDDGFVNRSDFLTNRRGTDPLIQSKADKISEFLSSPMNLIDNFTSEVIVRAAYDKYVRQGMDPQSAMQAADEFAAGVMADRSKGATPTIFSSHNPLTKLLTQFQVEVNNEFSTIFKDIPKGVHIPDKEKKNMAAVAAWTMLRYFIGAYLFNDLYEKLVGRRAALDPIDILNDAVGDLTGAKLNNTFDMLTEGVIEREQLKNPSDALTEFGKNAAEELPFIGGLMGGGRIPISSALPDAETIVKGLSNENWSGAKKAQAVGRELGKTVGTYILPPFAGGALKKAYQTAENTIQGGRFVKNAEGEDQMQYPYFMEPSEKLSNLTDYMLGEAENKEEISNAVQKILTVGGSLLYGPTATEGGRDWVEGGFGNQSAKVTTMYRRLTDEIGESQRDAWNLIQTINDGEYGRDTMAKRYAIAQSNLSEEGKALAMETYMSESEGRKFRGASEFGVTAGEWAALYRAMDEYDVNDNNTYSQKEIVNALDNITVPLNASEGMTQGLFGGSTDERYLTNREKAILWAAYGYKQNGNSWKQSNNPYDPEVGERVIDWIDGLDYGEEEDAG